MRSNGAKRVFLALLVACFALLFALLASRSVDGEMAVEREYPRKNMALSLSLEEDGVICIDGEGKLYANDLKAMLKMAGIHTAEVRDVIVGDGIAEIGYKAFYHIKTLETLKLGSSVVRVAPGALNYCASLKWLYLPSAAREIGAGFLHACEQCRVVTDARSEDLPPLENVEPESIIAEVDSFEGLRLAMDADAALPDVLARWWP